MQCPLCNYLMSDFDTECARCHGKGLAPPPQAQAAAAPPPHQQQLPPQPPSPGQHPQAMPGAAPDDAPSFPMAALGFFIPLVGLILFLVDRNTRPQRARSAGMGALVGFLGGIAVTAFFFMVIVGSAVAPVVGRSVDNAERTVCLNNLKQLALASMQYSMKNGEQFPDLTSPAAIKSALGQFTTNQDIFACSKGQEYLGNPAISQKRLADVPNAATTILFYDAQDNHLGGRNVAYADGHVQYLDAGKWASEKLRSGLS